MDNKVKIPLILIGFAILSVFGYFFIPKENAVLTTRRGRTAKRRNLCAY